MTYEEQEFTDFMKEASAKVIELQEKYDKLSDNNKARFVEYVMPMFRTLEAQDLFNQINKFFSKGIR